jgi:hypothetical protein
LWIAGRLHALSSATPQLRRVGRCSLGKYSHFVQQTQSISSTKRECTAPWSSSRCPRSLPPYPYPAPFSSLHSRIGAPQSLACIASLDAWYSHDLIDRPRPTPLPATMDSQPSSSPSEPPATPPRHPAASWQSPRPKLQHPTPGSARGKHSKARAKTPPKAKRKKTLCVNPALPTQLASNADRVPFQARR